MTQPRIPDPSRCTGGLGTSPWVPVFAARVPNFHIFNDRTDWPFCIYRWIGVTNITCFPCWQYHHAMKRLLDDRYPGVVLKGSLCLLLVLWMIAEREHVDWWLKSVSLSNSNRDKHLCLTERGLHRRKWFNIMNSGTTVHSRWIHRWSVHCAGTSNNMQLRLHAGMNKKRYVFFYDACLLSGMHSHAWFLGVLTLNHDDWGIILKHTHT